MDTYSPALGSSSLVGSNGLQLAKEQQSFLGYLSHSIKFGIRHHTHLLPFPLQPLSYSFLFHYKNTSTAG